MAFCRLDRSRSAAGSATRRGYAPRERRDKEGVGQREDVSRNSACKGDDGQRGGRKREGGGSRWRRDVLLVEQSNTETASRGETPSTALSSRVHRTVATNSSAFLRHVNACAQWRRIKLVGKRVAKENVFERWEIVVFESKSSDRRCSIFQNPRGLFLASPVHTDFFLLFSSVRRVFFTRHAKVAEFVILRITTSLFRETST